MCWCSWLSFSCACTILTRCSLCVVKQLNDMMICYCYPVLLKSTFIILFRKIACWTTNNYHQNALRILCSHAMLTVRTSVYIRCTFQLVRSWWLEDQSQFCQCNVDRYPFKKYRQRVRKFAASFAILPLIRFLLVSAGAVRWPCHCLSVLL